MSKTPDTLTPAEVIKTCHAKLKKHYRPRLTQVILYGSYARANETLEAARLLLHKEYPPPHCQGRGEELH